MADDCINICGNTIIGCGMPGILVTATVELKVENNVFENWPGRDYTKDLVNSAGLDEPQPVITVHRDP